jgi:transcriptional regulator with XRE-family HTH domain
LASVENKKIGERIKEARLACKLSSTERLAKLIPKDPGRPHHGAKITRQTVDNWENGQIPPWDMIQELARVFRDREHPEYGEQWILFGDTQHQVLTENVTPEELRLLMAYRRTNTDGKPIMLRDVESIAEKYPEQRGKVHQLRPVNNHR